MKKIISAVLLLCAPVLIAAQTSIRQIPRGTFNPRDQQRMLEEDKRPEEKQPPLYRQPAPAAAVQPRAVVVDTAPVYVPYAPATPAVVHPAPRQGKTVINSAPNYQQPSHHYTSVRYIRTRSDIPNVSKGWPREVLGLSSLPEYLNGSGVNIAVFDSGVSPHGNLNGKVDVMDVTGAGQPGDEFGHGTAVTGILVGGNNSERGFKSVASGARVKSYKITYKENNEHKTNNVHIENAVNSVLEYNAARPDNKIDIINISYGLSGGDERLESILKKAYDSGIVIVAAAGNNSGGLLYPAAYNFVIGVGAMSKNKQIVPYSSFGAGLDFIAPGEDIFALGNDNDYVWLDGGTSYSAAYISGIAALIIQEWRKKNGSQPSPAQIYGVLQKISSAVPSAPSQKRGNGLPDASKIMSAV
ncbi:MAG: S8 family serine peptidase [Elusimicrobiota bacterium]|jgi:hypothetical protein|nr:S8 family serine peptidase [Elusimicrobiota bacterium]